MAEKRMFSRHVIDSDLFLEMPVSTQLLYFHLAMRADDDGFINSPKRISRTVGCSDNDLKLLVEKQFIISFESGVVAIRHWKVHNSIRKDRYTPSIQPERRQIEEDSDKIYQLSTMVATNGIPSGCHLVDTEKNRVEENSIGKYSIDKESIEKENLNPLSDESGTPARAKKQRYGEYSHVLLTDGEFKKLHDEFSNADEAIAFLDEYIEYKGYSAKNHYLAMKKWVFKALSERSRPDMQNGYDRPSKDPFIEYMENVIREENQQ